jgi:hypothetical protein
VMLFVGCNKKFESDDIVYEIVANKVARTLTFESVLNCGDKFDGGNGVRLYLCEACKSEAIRTGHIW